MPDMIINITEIITYLLILLLLIYSYNDIIKPLIYNFWKRSYNNVEEFTQYSSSPGSITDATSYGKTVQFDTNYYLREPGKAIIKNNQISLPILYYGFYDKDGYEDLVGTYMRKHIYPIQPIRILSNIEAIYKFINGQIDIAFINEEILVRYYKRDCKYLTRLLAETFDMTNADLNDKSVLDRLYPPLNISAIGVGYNADIYLIVSNFSNIVEFMDIKIAKIAVPVDSYYYFVKICSAYGISEDMIKKISGIEENLESAIKLFKEDKYTGLFVITHPKNKQILALSQEKKVRYIHIQKREKLSARNNLTGLGFNKQGTNSIELIPPPSINRQAIYSESLLNDLKTENITESFNKIIKKYFQHLMNRTVDLNKFHRSGNIYSYLETYSTRMILVIRNNISKERVKYITGNYVNNLEKMRNKIDMEEFNTEINNFSSLEFNYEELVSFDQNIPLAEGAREFYKDEGLIYYEEETDCNV